MSDPTDLRFTPTHEWLRVEHDRIVVGISDFAQQHLTDIIHVELPEPDDHHYEIHEDIGVIESLKLSNDFHAPVSGTITSINTELLVNPELINEDPYGKGWLVVMAPDDPTDVEDLLDLYEYEANLPEERKKTRLVNPVATVALAGAASYLAGSIPFGYLVARSRGTDIRTVGSGNIGATNVFRCVGKGWGLLTFACDMGKGFVAAFAIPRMIGGGGDALPLETLAAICACLVVAGHNWPVFLSFRGGKGVATSAGVLLGIAWQCVTVGLLIWIVVFVLSRYVSLASLCASAAIAVGGWVLYAMGSSGAVIPILLTLLAAATIWRHKANIQRLARGTENRFDFKRRKGDAKA